MKHLKHFLIAVVSMTVALTLAACSKGTTTEKATTKGSATTENVPTATAKPTETGVVTTTEEEDDFEPALVYSGSVSGQFVYDEEENIYTAIIDLAQWGNIQIDYEKDEDTTITIWYDNTDIIGKVTAESLSGTDWSNNLYHEDVEGKVFFCYIASSYELTYDPVLETLYVDIHVVQEEEADEPDDETFEGAFAVAKWNVATTDYAVVYDSTYEGDIALSDYTIATDASGKIIFASRTSEGYGGPSDGIYHDGNYAWEAGEVCGIYDLDENFAPWPATYEGVNAWTLYNVVCPTGYHIITGTKAQMAKLIKRICNVTTFDINQDNTLFEVETNNGSLDIYKFEYTTGTDCVGIKIEEIEIVDTTGVTLTTTGTITTAMTKDASGNYYGEVTMNQWNNLTVTYNNGTADTKLWYDNCTVIGDVVNVDYGTTYGQNVLYVEDGKWFRSEAGEQVYEISYNPTANILTVAIKRQAKGLNVITQGTIVDEFTLVDGKYVGSVALNTWGHVQLDYTSDDLKSNPVWYTNATVTGCVTAVDVNGSDWSQKLYHETTGSSRFFSATGGTYVFVYDPVAGTLNILVPGLTMSGERTDVKALAKNDAGEWTGVFTLTGWNSVSFAYTNTQGNETVIWYDNTTVTGSVSDVGTEGCTWTTDLFHEGAGKAWLHYSDMGATTYKVTYNPTTNTINFEVVKPVGINVTTDATVVEAFTLADGIYTGKFTFNGWNSMTIVLSDGEGNDVTIWYDNTTISGNVTAAEIDGCGWNQNLYHENKEGKKWFHYGDLEAATYTIAYNKEANTLTITIVE